jgi:hypothetical protein
MTAIAVKRQADVHSYTADAFYSIGDLRDWIASAQPNEDERRRISRLPCRPPDAYRELRQLTNAPVA